MGYVLRIHFTVADAMNVRVAGLGAFGELLGSFGKLQARGTAPLFGRWRERTVARARLLPPDVRELARFVAPPAHGLADLFTLVGPADEYAEAVERLCATPREPLRQELSYAPLIAGVRANWIADFADGDRAARQRMTRALDGYHDVAIAPYWSRIRAVLDRDRTDRLGILARAGLGAMLESLAPGLRWQPPVLEVPSYRPAPGHTDVHLDGRGLVVVPSVFNAADPGVFLPWDDGPVLLLYQVPLDPPTATRLWRDPDAPTDRAVATLLGTTRAAALRVVADGCTTTELARRLNISPGGASQHATVLRESGLIVSRRHRNTMRHSITRLGRDLLDNS